MRQIELVIQNPTGLHARPAKVLVRLAKQFKADIQIRCNQKRVNCKSMVSLLTLGATRGSCISLEASGEDEEVALTEIGEAIRSGLGDLETPTKESTLAETSAKLELQPKLERQESDSVSSINGISAAPGIAVGPIFQYQPSELIHNDLDSALGIPRLTLNEALVQAKQQLAALRQQMADKKLEAEAAIFEAQSEFLDDTELIENVQARVAVDQDVAKGWRAAIDERATAIASVGDTLLAARADDLRDVGRLVLGLLLGIADKGIALPEQPVVLVASDLSPSVMATLDPMRVLGFAIVHGGPTSHVAILARAMGLPAIVGVQKSILNLAANTIVILDGNKGTLVVNPEPAVLEKSKRAQNLWLESRQRAHETANLPAVTIDGRRVDVTANAGSLANAAQAMKMGADGIGLLRTEFLFLDRSAAPDEEEQFSVYRSIAETMNSLPVIVRTLDVGGDKPLDYIHLSPEANPFLGERGIRLCLNRPELFCEQLRAILRAAKYGNLQIMFPMVSDIGELREARVLIEEQCRRLNVPPVKIGIMVEVPSAALLADKLASEVEFFSIGTNDLTQYTLAMDRGHAGLAAKQDGLHPAVLRLIAHTVDAAHKHGKRVDLCGELGSDVTAIPILVGLGVDELSVSIPAVPMVKAQVRTLTLGKIQPLARQALECSTALEVRELMRKFIPECAS
jgi:phosphocarrier protein FPr